MEGQAVSRDARELVRIARAAQSNVRVCPLQTSALEVRDAADQVLGAVLQQCTLQVGGGELHLGEGTGPNRVFVHSDCEGEGLRLHHGDEQAIPWSGPCRVIDQDLAEPRPALVEHCSLRMYEHVSSWAFPSQEYSLNAV